MTVETTTWMMGGAGGGWDENRGKGMIYDFRFLLPMDEVGYFGVICVAGKV